MKSIKELADKHCRRGVKTENHKRGKSITLPSAYHSAIDAQAADKTLSKEERRALAKADQARMNAEYWASGRDEKFSQPFKQAKPCVYHGGVTSNRSNS